MAPHRQAGVRRTSTEKDPHRAPARFLLLRLAILGAGGAIDPPNRIRSPSWPALPEPQVRGVVRGTRPMRARCSAWMPVMSPSPTRRYPRSPRLRAFTRGARHRSRRSQHRLGPSPRPSQDQGSESPTGWSQADQLAARLGSPARLPGEVATVGMPLLSMPTRPASTYEAQGGQKTLTTARPSPSPPTALATRSIRIVLPRPRFDEPTARCPATAVADRKSQTQNGSGA